MPCDMLSLCALSSVPHNQFGSGVISHLDRMHAGTLTFAASVGASTAMHNSPLAPYPSPDSVAGSSIRCNQVTSSPAALRPAPVAMVDSTVPGGQAQGKSGASTSPSTGHISRNEATLHAQGAARAAWNAGAVSYTHLTLPTILLV